MRELWLLVVLLTAATAFAQDEAPAGGLAGSGGAQVFSRVDAVNPMDQVKTFLVKINITLTADQEKALRPTVEAALQQLRDISESAGAGRGGRGDRKGGAPSLAVLANGPAAEQIRRINDNLIAKITEVLKPDQQAVFKKFLNDQIKKAGGFGALKLAMEEAGAPLTAEQEPQIQAFYDEDAKQRAQMLRESQGKPDPAKIADLQKATMASVVKVLTPAQRKALLDSRTKQQ